MGKVKEYSNGEVTVVWEAEKCIHSAICAKGLPEVFQPKERPWIKIDAAATDALVKQVKACPSGALSYKMNNETLKESLDSETKVDVHGTLKVVHKDGTEETKNKTTAFCRCGSSANKPYCDGAHNKQGFVG